MGYVGPGVSSQKNFLALLETSNRNLASSPATLISVYSSNDFTFLLCLKTCTNPSAACNFNSPLLDHSIEKQTNSWTRDKPLEVFSYFSLFDWRVYILSGHVKLSERSLTRCLWHVKQRYYNLLNSETRSSQIQSFRVFFPSIEEAWSAARSFS